MVSVISNRALSARWQMTRSGFRISRSAGASMSAAVTVPAPSFCTCTSTSPDSPWSRQIRLFRFRMMSITSSRTPGTEVNSCATPSIFTEVTAAPSSEDMSTRRRLLPNVYPKPRSSGSTTKVPTVSPASSDVILGMISSMWWLRPLRLLGVELDDQLLLHRGVDVDPVGQPQHLARQVVVVGLEPRGHRGGQVGRVGHHRLGG